MSGTLQAHLDTGCTTLCGCWALTRRDGLERGFTDHDRGLAFDGIDFEAETGLSASALVQGTGLAVDNAEALGVLNSAGVTEAEIAQGRLDGAELRLWLVNWADVTDRVLRFRGTIGEIRRSGAVFHAELRGLTDALNQPVGRIYQSRCTAVLGDAGCRFDLDRPGYAVTLASAAPVGADSVSLALDLPGEAPAAGWFDRGRLEVTSGAAAGLSGAIKSDRVQDGARQVTLWQPMRAAIAVGDGLRLVAGCDKRAETCRGKFDNMTNFQGFPSIPGSDWLMAVPRRAGGDDG